MTDLAIFLLTISIYGCLYYAVYKFAAMNNVDESFLWCACSAVIYIVMSELEIALNSIGLVVGGSPMIIYFTAILVDEYRKNKRTVLSDS